jgi:hypothetical protein
VAFLKGKIKARKKIKTRKKIKAPKAKGLGKKPRIEKTLG